MHLIIGSMEIVSLIVLLVVLYGHLFEGRMQEPVDKAFLYCIVLTLLGLCSDIPAWLLDGKTGIDGFLYVINLLAFLFGELISAAFSFYLYYTISKNVNISKIPFYIIASIDVLSVVIMVIGCCCGQVFTIINGEIVFLKMHSLTSFVGVLSLFAYAVIIVKNARTLKIHDTCVLLVYIIIPACALMFEAVNPDVSLIYVALTISLLILYVMLQVGRINDFYKQELLLQQYTYTDSLTGLPNRRAYEKALSEIGKYDDVGVIYCDANYLKYTNDTAGHDYGDKLLLNVASLLRKHFSKDTIFRVGGDEFIVLVGGITRHPFISRCEKLYNDVVENENISSLGYAHGKTENINDLIHEAEKLMYEDKTKNYRKYPERKRNSQKE